MCHRQELLHKLGLSNFKIKWINMFVFTGSILIISNQRDSELKKRSLCQSLEKIVMECNNFLQY